jgi:hypothetical protein
MLQGEGCRMQVIFIKFTPGNMHLAPRNPQRLIFNDLTKQSEYEADTQNMAPEKCKG